MGIDSDASGRSRACRTGHSEIFLKLSQGTLVKKIIFFYFGNTSGEVIGMYKKKQRVLQDAEKCTFFLI